MSEPDFQKEYEEQNRRDYIANARFGSIVSIPLNLSCSVMDHFMYPDKMWPFFKLRVACGILTALIWFWFTRPKSSCPLRVFGITWFTGPLLMIYWMIYTVNDPLSPYYAGLNIILLAMGFISPFTYKQNFCITVFVLAMYVAVALLMATAQPVNYILNNTTFIFLTAAFVVLGSRSNERQRFKEFSLRWELDKNKRAIEESNRKLMELDEAKGRFFANISHELRTPLTLLIAPLETLINRFSRAFETDTKELLATMHANGMRLLKLINDLLDLVRLESGRIEVRPEPIEVADLVKGLASSVRQVANDKRINLETKVDPELGWIKADRDKLEKILHNLLFNALKFTPSGGRVSLFAEKAGEKYILKVQDTGMGIAKKNVANLFSRFWQADDSSRRKFQGVGIGLALVKELTEVQGGTVAVESEQNKGTTFTVTLPYVKSEPLESAPVATEVQANGTATSDEWLSNLYRRAELFPGMTPVQDSVRRVETGRQSANLPKALIADDEPDMLRFLKSQLTGRYQVFEAVDGQQAIDKAGQFLPDVILLDMMMPEKDGLQACKELRQRPSTQSIPIILLTARADEQTKLAALSAGASDFLPKPFSTTELHVRIKNLVESYHYQRKLSKQNVVLEETIEQLKETETALVETEKLASLGRFSAGIIHEINNPLNFATTGLYTLKRKAKFIPPEEQEEYAEILKDVEDGIARVKTIVSDLRSFSHNENDMIEQVEVAEVITQAQRFLSHEVGQIQVYQTLAENQTVWANKNKLIQVAVNLLQNSIDALKGKQFGESEKPSIWIEGRVDQGKSTVVFRDNGTGIEAGHLDKVFDPFFTTKDVGAGMGLGLSICYRIVRSYEGRITVRSEHGKFCEFTLEFPVKGNT